MTINLLFPDFEVCGQPSQSVFWIYNIEVFKNVKNLYN